MSTCTEADNMHIQEALSPVQHDPESPESTSMSNPNQNESEQVLLATMQPVNVLDLHESAGHALHHKYHHHRHNHHNHHTKVERTTDEVDDRVSPESAPNAGLGEHKMIDLMYNDGQKTVVYTHDKEIIYENEADRVQVVEYPPPPPSPPSSPPTSRGDLIPLNYGTSRNTSGASALHLHHYPPMHLAQEDDLPRVPSVTNSVSNCAAGTTTTTVLVLSELVADPSNGPGGATSQHISLPAAALRTGRRNRAEAENAGVAEEAQQPGYGGVGRARDVDEDEELSPEEAQTLQTAAGVQAPNETGDPEVHKRVAAVQVQVQGMEGDWRAYCEHPLSVATAAMLNLQQQHQVSGVSGHAEDPAAASYVYEYYKLPEKTADVKLPPTHELWSTGVMGQKLLVQEAPGTGSTNRIEGNEGSGGGELHHFLHQYNQQSHSPGQSLQSGLPLPLSPQSLRHDGSSSGGIAGVKREPEDLSSSRGGSNGQNSKRHKQSQPDSPTPPGMYHHHQHQIQLQQYVSPYEHSPHYSSCSPRLQTTAYTPTTAAGANTTGLHPEATAVYVTGETLPPLASSSSSSLSTTTASYTRYEVVPSTYATTHAIRSSSSSSKALTVDLPSPDSGIGADAVTPRQDHHAPTALHQSSFDYTELCPGGAATAATVVIESGAVIHHQPLQLQLQQNHTQTQVQRGGLVSAGTTTTTPNPNPPRSRPWHDFGRQNDADKIQIPKIYSAYGFKYHLESPISTSQRREDDRITYINKGQFYGITLDYVPDPDKPLLKPGQTVKSVIMLMFREEKSPEDEIKAWQFWHGRQHSVKQRILDADTKNSVGLVGCIEEIAHNAIAVYWNPSESSAKINVAVQCLSTDFSSQKGVKGLPLHIQIDSYEDPSQHNPTFIPPTHRGYCQIKVFCDKGAERKTRDEERRAAKRKMTATGRKKLDELYHSVTERSEFYSMADLHKPPVLFSPPAEHSIDKFSTMELSGFYGGGGGGGGGDTDTSSLSNGEGGGLKTGGSSPYPACGGGRSSLPALKFHNHFPPDNLSSLHDKKDSLLMQVQELQGSVLQGVPPTSLAANSVVTGTVGNRLHSTHLRGPDAEERVMLYVRQETEDVYTPLHVTPPSVQGLLNADQSLLARVNDLFKEEQNIVTMILNEFVPSNQNVQRQGSDWKITPINSHSSLINNEHIESKYKIATSSINNLYRKNTKGVTAKIDDDMIRYYVDEDLFILEVSHSRISPENRDNPGSPNDPNESPNVGYDITLIELPSSPAPLPPSPLAPTAHAHTHAHTHAHVHGHVHESAST